MSTASDRRPPAEPSADDLLPSLGRRRSLLLLPVGVFAALAGVFGMTLIRPRQGLQSALIGRPVPTFSLLPVQRRTLGLSSEDLVGEVSLVNVFASWCAPCRAEHPLLLDLKRRGVVTIHGINHRDDPDNAAAWLDELGDPYTRTGADINGSVSIDWGVYGIPETFVVDSAGTIAYRHVGALTETSLANAVLPLVGRLRQ